MRRPVATALLAAAACAAAPVPAGAAGAAAVAPLTVVARPGQADRVAAALGRSALRVHRRDGRRLQVAAAPGRAAALAALPGVAAAHPAAPAFGDETAAAVVTQGLLRTGAASLVPAAAGGRGLVIAILDLGFGTGLERMAARGELPQPAALETRSFDAVDGLAGRNAYGNTTNHGELVAQTVYDYAPQARYVFVNYRSEQDFTAAVDWLVARRPDIVVHSNSFIEGPFDGTGPAARAVDRAAAAGILWVNSAGNYADRHWEGPWTDADGDGALDWGGVEAGVFYGPAGRPITFAVSWPSPPGGPAADLDIALERIGPDGTWAPVAVSADRQSLGAAPAERITGHLPPADGYFRLRVTRASGPLPAGPVTVFSREVNLPLVMGGGVASSVPTPGDAAGSLTVGAVDWRGDRLKPYSSQGPTDDGRPKPDLVAPTDTVLAGPSGPRLVGGTSNAAPNAAGAAAVLMAVLRGQGLAPSAAEVRDRLAASALDLGVPGPDAAYGAGRVRVDMAPPVFRGLAPAEGAAVRGPVTFAVRGVDAGGITRLTLRVGGRALRSVRTTDRLGVRVDTRRLPDGPAVVTAEGLDWTGNAGRRDWRVTVDNTAPSVRLLGVVRAGARAAAAGRAPVRPRAAYAVLALRDRTAAPMRLAVAVGSGRARSLAVRPSERRRVYLGRLRPGPLRVRLVLTDRAGNARTVNRVVRFR